MAKKKITKQKNAPKKSSIKNKKSVVQSRVAPRSVPSRKQIQKVTAEEKLVDVRKNESRVRKTEQRAVSPKPVSAKVIAAEVPSRAPIKRVLGRAPIVQKVTEERGGEVSSATTAPNPAKEVHSLKDSLIIQSPVDPNRLAADKVLAAEKVITPRPNVPWTALPKTVPPTIRYFVAVAERECRAAARWPFPFARFLAALPSTVSGLTISGFFLSTIGDGARVSDMLRIPADECFALMKSEGDALIELFEKQAPDMARKLRTQLSGVGVPLEQLLERHLVSEVSSDFQVAICHIVKRCYLGWEE